MSYVLAGSFAGSFADSFAASFLSSTLGSDLMADVSILAFFLVPESYESLEAYLFLLGAPFRAFLLTLSSAEDSDSDSDSASAFFLPLPIAAFFSFCFCSAFVARTLDLLGSMLTDFPLTG
jgi:hypothetical protein